MWLTTCKRYCTPIDSLALLYASLCVNAAERFCKCVRLVREQPDDVCRAVSSLAPSLAKLGNMRLDFNKQLLSSTQLSLIGVISARNLPPRENNGAPNELMISTACISSHSSLIITLFTSYLWLDSFSSAFTWKCCGGAMVHDIRCNTMVIYCIP